MIDNRTTSIPTSDSEVGIYYVHISEGNRNNGIYIVSDYSIPTTVTKIAELSTTYIFNQNMPNTIWDINHNLNKYPSVMVVDSAGTEVLGEVIFTSLNSLQLSFNSAFSGIATLI